MFVLPLSFKVAAHLFRLSCRTWDKRWKTKDACGVPTKWVQLYVTINLCSGNCSECCLATIDHIEFYLFTDVPINSAVFWLHSAGLWYYMMRRYSTTIYHHWYHFNRPAPLPPDYPPLHHLLTEDHPLTLFLCISGPRAFFSGISSSAAAAAAITLRWKLHSSGGFKLCSVVLAATFYFYITTKMNP